MSGWFGAITSLVESLGTAGRSVGTAFGSARDGVVSMVDSTFKERQQSLKDANPVAYPFALIIISSHGELTGQTRTAPYNICIKHNTEFGCYAFGDDNTIHINMQLLDTAIRPATPDTFLGKLLALEEKYYGKGRYEKWHAKTAHRQQGRYPSEMLARTGISPLIGCDGNKEYFNKSYEYSDDLMMGGSVNNSGIFVGDNNLGIEEGSILTELLSSRKRICTLEEIISYFNTKYFHRNRTAQLFINDTTCAGVSSIKKSRQDAIIAKATSGAIPNTGLPSRHLSLASALRATMPIQHKKKHIYYEVIDRDKNGNYDYFYWDTEDQSVSFDKPTITDNIEIIRPNWVKDGRNWITTLLSTKYDSDGYPERAPHRIDFDPNVADARYQDQERLKSRRSGNMYYKTHLEEDTQSSVGSGGGSYARTPDVQAQPRSASSVTRGNKPKCKCAKSQSEPTTPCPNPAIKNGFCGIHKTCKFILGGGRKKTQKNRKF